MSVLPETTTVTELETAQAKIAELEQKLAASEAAHQQAKTFFQDVIDAMPTRVFWKDRESRFLGANVVFAKDLGDYTPADLIGKRDVDLGVDPDNAERYVKDDQLVITGGKTKNEYEESQKTPNGQQAWILTEKTPLRNNDQSVYGVMGMYRDITEQKLRETALEWALRRSSDLIDLSSALVQVTTNSELLSALNKNSFALENNSLSLFHFEDYQEDRPTTLRMVESLRTQESGIGRLPIGTRFEIDKFPFSKLYLENPDQPIIIPDTQTDTRFDKATAAIFKSLNIGAAILIPMMFGNRLIGLFQLVYEKPRQWAEDETMLLEALPPLLSPVVYNLRLVGNLEEKVTELNAALIFKDQFLAIMSHELRTPLNAILGYSSIGLQMESAATPEKMRHMMTRIVANSERLLHLINEILDLSRINAGRVEIVQSPYNLHETANHWHEDFEKRILAKGLAFNYTLDEQLPTMIVGDQERLAQVVTNLLENAIKFTEKGEISLKVGRKDDDKMTFEVRDTGIGISPTWHHLIFEEFRRVEMDSVRKTGGAGLGLSIVQRLCKLMGGGVTVESELGVGSTFVITLPIVTETEKTR